MPARRSEKHFIAAPWARSCATFRSLARAVVPLPQRLHQALLFGRQLLRFELEGQLVELASEAERHVVAVLEKCDRRTRVHANVKGLVPLEDERDSVLNVLLVDLAAVDRQRAGPALPQASAIELEVEAERVLAGLEFGARPDHALR